jgi:hypothetical protein
LPEPPDLDQVGALARAETVDQIAHEADANGAVEAAVGDAGAREPVGASPGSEPNLVGVMDPDAGTPVFDDSDAPADVEAVPAGMIDEDELGQTAGDADAPPASGISAATLLRNLAPWTKPDRTSDDNSD